MILDLDVKEYLGDFNTKLSRWHKKDNSASEGILIKSNTLQFGLHQIINKPTHITQNSSLHIYLIFTLQPNLSAELGTQPQLTPHCYLKITYTKFNVDLIYPPSYTSKTCHYQDSNVDLVRQSIKEFDYDRALENKHVDKKVLIFSKIVLNILISFISDKV